MIVLIPCRCDGTAAETPQIREHFFEGNENCRETRKSRPKTKREKKKKKKVADEDEKCVGKNKVVPERRVHSDGFAELALEKTLNTRAQKTKEADQNSDTVIFSLSRLGASGFFLQLRLGGTLQSKHQLDQGQDSVNGAWSTAAPDGRHNEPLPDQDKASCSVRRPRVISISVAGSLDSSTRMPMMPLSS